jgi:hypothetical protein
MPRSRPPYPPEFRRQMVEPSEFVGGAATCSRFRTHSSPSSSSTATTMQNTSGFVKGCACATRRAPRGSLIRYKKLSTELGTPRGKGQHDKGGKEVRER